MTKLTVKIVMEVPEELDEEQQAAAGVELTRALSGLVHESAPDSLPESSVTWKFD